MIDPRDRGDLVHTVLEATFRHLAESGSLPLTRERLPAAREALDAAFAAAVRRSGAAGPDRAAGALGGRAGSPSRGAPVRSGGRGG